MYNLWADSFATYDSLFPKQASTPSGNLLAPSAPLILKNAQTSSDIDDTLAPTQITKTFKANQYEEKEQVLFKRIPQSHR